MVRKLTKKRSNIASLIGVLFLVLSLGVGLFLVSKPQILQEKAVAACPAGYAFSSHLHDCKKNCTNDRAPDSSWIWINATTGANCGTGTGGTPKFWCDVDECVIAPKTATPTPTPTPDTQTDPNNCGAIGNVCPNGTSCKAGQCVPPATATPTPTPTPTPSPSPSPSPTLRPNPWDVDQNGIVNIVDIGLIIDNYGKNPALDPRTDVNMDGVVDIVDIGIVIDHYSF